MESVQKALRLIGIGIIVAALIVTTYFAGYESGYHGGQVASRTGLSAPAAEAEASLKEQRSVQATPTPEEEAAFAIFWEAWKLLKNEFYGDLPDPRRLAYGAIQGVVKSLGDEHTAFLDPEQAALFNTDIAGTFEGIGARVDEVEGGGVRIIEPFEGQPAWRAGIRRDDVVIAVDGKDITKMTLYETISLIRGPKGTKVVLTIRRAGVEKPFDVEVTRARIEIPTVTSKFIGTDIAYVKLAEFNGQATSQLRAELRRLLARKPAALIFDLRGNPGGLLSSAVEIGSMFIADGNILSERFRDGREETYPREGDLIVPQDLPVVVLVNGGSASAAEIVAGAIQDTGRAILMGEKTYGKGSVQLPHALSDESQLRVTIARWFTPKGRLIHGQGLMPDVLVPRTDEDIQAEQDPQLDKAVEYLRAANKPPVTQPEGIPYWDGGLQYQPAGK
ncbi:MAG: S41 family peptidase [Anaerolineae bacterium]|nr:S41 family peptidase [Anaerolineae bacterium]